MPYSPASLLFATALAVACPVVEAQTKATPSAQHAHNDSTFAEMQRRGERAMGVDQYTSRHTFESLANGGRIALQAAPADSVAIPRIRMHFRSIARAFARGTFTDPAFVHAGEAPGTRTMTARRKAIRYIVRDVPRGAELLITTRHPEALRAIHEFLQFQRREHWAGEE